MVPDSTNAYHFTTFNATIGSGLIYNWNFGDGTAAVSTVSPAHTYTTAGTYNIFLTDSSGTCTNTTCHSLTVSGTVNSCNALFNIAHDTSSSNPNGYSITNLSYGSNLTYSWNFGDTTTSTAVHPTHTYANIGPYQICLTVNNGAGCNQTYCDWLYAVDSLHTHLQPIVISVVGNNQGATVGINEHKEINYVEIYPNPFTSSTTISFSSEQKNSTLYIRDVLGKEINKENFSGKQFIIEKGVLSNGIYFVEIRDENKISINKKIIIQ